jgi:hypothetical protein
LQLAQQPSGGKGLAAFSFKRGRVGEGTRWLTECFPFYSRDETLAFGTTSASAARSHLVGSTSSQRDMPAAVSVHTRMARLAWRG